MMLLLASFAPRSMYIPSVSLRESRIGDVLTLRFRTEKGMIPRLEVPGQNTNIRELA